MKNTIKRFWGVALVVILLSTLFVGGTVSSASASTLAWSVQAIPTTSSSTYQVVTPATYGGFDVANVVAASDGTLFAVDSHYGNKVYKSTTGGVSWTASSTIGSTTTNITIVDLVVSPTFATDSIVLVLANTGAAGVGPAQVYISTNKGTSFAVLGGTCGTTAAEIGTSLAVSPTYTGQVGEILVGTADTGAGAYGKTYIWGKNSVQNWDSTVSPVGGADVSKVAYSPNYALDMTRLAITSNITGTRLETLVASDAAWDTTLASPVIDATVNATGEAAGIGNIARATIAFPSDYNASSAYYRACYIGIVSNNATTAAQNTIYRFGTTSGVAANLGPSTVYGALAATSIAYSGTTASGSLYAGLAGALSGNSAVVYTTSPTSSNAVVAPTWYAGTNSPSGAGGTAYIALAPDFATSATVYVGTAGAESAFSVSSDGGLTYRAAGLIDTMINTICDFQTASATEFWMVTNSVATTNTTSVWKTTNGATWYRYFVKTTTATLGTVWNGIIRISPNYATDHTVVFGLLLAAAPSNIYNTTNSGSSWTAKSTPVGITSITDLAVKDQYTYYIADSATNKVQATNNGAWTWQSSATTVSSLGTQITSIKLNLASGALLCGDNVGNVYVSTNNNVSWTKLALSTAGVAAVAFDTNYATNGFVYAVNTTSSDVKAFATGFTGFVAMNTNTGLNDVTGLAVNALSMGDLLSTPDGSLYTISVAGGINRSLNPTSTTSQTSYAEWNNISYLLTATNAPSFSKLAYVAGSNLIYAIDTANNYIWVFGDTLAGSTTSAAPTQTAPANSTVYASSSTVSVTWNAVDGADSYQVYYDTRSDFLTKTVSAAVVYPRASLSITGLSAGKTYYWKVRVIAPVYGPWSSVRTFLTELAPATPNAPAIYGDFSGGTRSGGYNASITPTFQWQTVTGATGYEFVLAADAALTNLVVNDVGTSALTANVFQYNGSIPLAYSTTYYWKVRGVSASSFTDWSEVQAFSTMAAPTTSAAPVTITQQAAPTITIPQATSTQIVITQPATKEVNPTYIWAIIIIGAVLVLAVIVLIVRTRRSV